jgi:hypothetical protein
MEDQDQEPPAEDRKRPAEDPLGGGHDEKRQRVEEAENVRDVLLDPETWRPYVFSDDSPTIPGFPPPLEHAMSQIRSLMQRDSTRFIVFNARLTSFPPIVFGCGLFTTIDFSSNFYLTRIPDEIARWAGDYLSLRRTGITHLPPQIGDCQQLMIIELELSRIRALPRRLGKCQSLVRVYLDSFATIDPERPLLAQFDRLSADEVARKLKRDWASYVTSMSCLLFCLETRICKETPEGISGDIPRDILPHIASFL